MGTNLSIRVVAIAAASMIPPLCLGADRDLIDLSRDVAGIQDQLARLRMSAEQQTTKLDDALQQVAKSLAKINASLNKAAAAASQQLSPAQTGASAMAGLGARLDSLRGAAGSLRASFVDINSRMNTMERRLSDVGNALGALGTPQAGSSEAGSPAASSSAPNGLSAATLYQNALRDESRGNYDLALAEFADYLKYFSGTDTAGGAQFEIGQIYYKQKHFDKALEAFAQVPEKYPASSHAADAYYMQGMSLIRLNQPQKAAEAFKQVVQKHPNSNAAAQATLQLQNLNQAK